jgi:predicted DNA-binding WGR domain protein
MEWRRCEKARDGVVEYWEIRCEGIRCHMAWGREGGRRQAKTMALGDNVQARRHLERKVRQKLRKGYVEVAPRRSALDTEPTEQPSGKLLDLLKDAERYLPVVGRDQVYLWHFPFEGGPGPLREYLLLRNQERDAVSVLVKDSSARPDDLAAFLDFLDARRDLPFDGRSHHKVALPAPIGRLTHALLCSPALGWSDEAPGKIAAAFPIFDCEIGDADTEVLVDARIKGRDCLPHSTWSRSPHPVIDLRFELRPAKAATFELHGPHLRQAGKFKVHSRPSLETLVQMLADATTDSYVEIRSFRGQIKTLRPRDLTPKTAAEINSFLLGPVQ